MIAKAPRCDECNIDFKNNKCYKQHIKSSGHITRSSETYIAQEIVEGIFKCTCGKSYKHRQSAHVHKKKCEKYQTCKKAGVCCKFKPPILIAETLEETMQKERSDHRAIVETMQKNHLKERSDHRAIVETMQKKHEKERSDHRAIVEAMNQKIEVYKNERKEMKDKIAVLLHNATKHDAEITTNKTQDKRKKINKKTRQLIAEKQENACGECKLALTPYFELDHIIGLQFGGTDEESNLMALCRECHAKKSIGENQCRKQIQDAIKTILRESETTKSS